MKTERVTMTIYGLSCGGGGALTLERALAHLRGVASVYVNPGTEMAYVEFDPSMVTTRDLTRSVEELGLKAGELTWR